MEVVGVKFNLNSQIYSFDPKGLKLAEGDKVIVETSRGVEWGEIKSLKNVPEDQIAFELKPVLRKVTESDEKQISNNIADAKAAIPKIKEKADELNLPMIIKNAEYTFDRSKFIVYYTANDRIPFQDIVKYTAGMLKTRIEMRQINSREEVLLYGSLGVCGHPCCCTRYAPNGVKATVKMGKIQGLQPNPEKLAGFCGKIMCCLAFENDDYEKIQAQLPTIGSSVNTPDGIGTVLATSNIKETVTVELKDELLSGIRTYPLSDITITNTDNLQNHKKDSNKNIADDAVPDTVNIKNKSNKESEHNTDNNTKKGNFFKHKKKKWHKPPVKQ